MKKKLIVILASAFIVFAGFSGVVNMTKQNSSELRIMSDPRPPIG
ncbi:hypothetical protein WD019_02285 [Fictibacillus sp. Mic-4]